MLWQHPSFHDQSALLMLRQYPSFELIRPKITTQMLVLRMADFGPQKRLLFNCSIATCRCSDFGSCFESLNKIHAIEVREISSLSCMNTVCEDFHMHYRLHRTLHTRTFCSFSCLVPPPFLFSPCFILQLKFPSP